MRRLAFLFSLLTTFSVFSGSPVSEDPMLEKRVMALAEELRCLVCQNQTLADSHAALAIDLKNRIRELLREGKSEREVLDFMVQRYGDFVLYRPPLQASTALLWAGPFILLVVAVVGLIAWLRKRKTLETEAEGTP
ncbi:MAG TPA: cytochrome c-type biogenesis protein [Burkholderiales bacterium]|nr:cytochrome c-type biogenesis protein [Burkholderiales bacterium]